MPAIATETAPEPGASAEAAPWRMSEHWPELNLAFTQLTLEGVERLLRGFELLAQRGKISPEEQRVLTLPTLRLRQSAKQVQQIVRLHSGQVRQSHEKIDLSRVVAAVLLERQAELASLGVALHSQCAPVELLLDPTLGYALCQTLLDWALPLGRQMEWHLEPEPAGNAALLRLRVSAITPAAPQQALQDGMEWLLLRVLAATDGGIELERSAQGDAVQIGLRLRRLLTPPAGEASGAAQPTRSPPTPTQAAPAPP